jgi:hypothetical protein
LLCSGSVSAVIVRIQMLLFRCMLLLVRMPLLCSGSVGTVIVRIRMLDQLYVIISQMLLFFHALVSTIVRMLLLLFRLM